MDIRYAGIVVPKSYDEKSAFLTFEKNKVIENITIHLPRNIELEDDARLEAPNAYTALLLRWLDADYINLGFSGSAKGELEIASYIAGLEMSVLIIDYDHNAPTVEYLEKLTRHFSRKSEKHVLIFQYCFYQGLILNLILRKMGKEEK